MDLEFLFNPTVGLKQTWVKPVNMPLARLSTMKLINTCYLINSILKVLGPFETLFSIRKIQQIAVMKSEHSNISDNAPQVPSESNKTSGTNNWPIILGMVLLTVLTVLLVWYFWTYAQWAFIWPYKLLCRFVGPNVTTSVVSTMQPHWLLPFWRFPVAEVKVTAVSLAGWVKVLGGFLSAAWLVAAVVSLKKLVAKLTSGSSAK